MARYESQLDAPTVGKLSGKASEVIDVAVFGAMLLLSVLFVIMAGYFVMAWL
ncbi:MAG: hypothetical protein M1294_02865 [Firmicutes bacterium]|nr:hypothetical protein [Bacillota bacterium]MCL5012458.1 hypothetical protein [Bacillota bacterium]